LFVHFNDLPSYLSGEINRVADFLDIRVSQERLDAITNAVTFKNMKANATSIVPNMERSFKGGSQTFINQGTNGRWIGVLNDDDLEMYEAAVKRVLTPDLRKVARAQKIGDGRLIRPKSRENRARTWATCSARGGRFGLAWSAAYAT
jgi:hypothetical protein